MHGEYKTPGGKLVVVDFEIDDDALANVAVTGDFFLYPDEALEPIAAALEGLPATDDQQRIAEAVNAVIDDDVTLIGTSPEGIAIAVTRALAQPAQEAGAQ